MREIHKPETTGKGQSCVKGPGGLRWFDGGKGRYFACRSTPFYLKATVLESTLVRLVLRKGSVELRREEHPTIGDAFRRAAVLVHEARALLPRPLDTVRRKP